MIKSASVVRERQEPIQGKQEMKKPVLTGCFFFFCLLLLPFCLEA